jgi:translation initiation factor 4E
MEETKSNEIVAIPEIVRSYHPLKTKLVLYGHIPSNSKDDYSFDTYRKLAEFHTMEDVIYISQLIPDYMITNSMLFLMKNNILPMYEDENNIRGGRFSHKISNSSVPRIWRELSAVLGGDTLSSNAEVKSNVTGITVSPKKGFSIVNIWMRTCKHQNAAVFTTDIKGISPVGCLFKTHG